MSANRSIDPLTDDATLPAGSPESAEPTVTCDRCGAGYTGDWCPSCGRSPAPVPCEEGGETRERCVLCGRAVCGGGRGTVPARCEPHAGIPIIEGWAQVYSATSDIDAGLVSENLRSEGIDAQVYSQKDDIFPVDLGELAIVRVMVPVWEFQQALEVVLDRMDSSGEVVFACPNCGEAYDPGDASCGACGAGLVG